MVFVELAGELLVPVTPLDMMSRSAELLLAQ